MRSDRRIALAAPFAVALLVLSLVGCLPSQNDSNPETLGLNSEVGSALPDALPDGAFPDGEAVWGGQTVSYQFAGAEGLAGNGQEKLTFLLVHGWGATSEAWRNQLKGESSWSDLGLVLSIDLPGHGESEASPIGFGFDMAAEAMKAVLDDAGVEQAILVGHSNGVKAALRFAELYPGRSAGLVALDGAMVSLGMTAEMVEPLLAGLQSDDYWEKLMSPILTSMKGPGSSMEDQQLLLDMAAKVPQGTLAESFMAHATAEGWPTEALALPTLAIKVRQPTWNEEYEAKVRQAFPELDYQLIEGSGHYLQLERPADLKLWLKEFLSARDLSAANAQEP